MLRWVLSFAFLVTLSSQCFAAGFGSRSYASSMQRSRIFQHDRSYRGAEVIYYSSGTATQQQAMSAWLRSPGHRALIQAGRISEISCDGNYCVGRGR